MYSLVLNDEPINVSIVSLMTKCSLFQTKPELLSKPYKVESGVSPDSLRMFVGVIGGAVAEISDANVRDLSQLCDEFKFVELEKTVRDWQAEHPLIDQVIRQELDLVQTALEERLESQARTMLMLDQALRRGREAALSDAEKMAAMKAELSELRYGLNEVLRNLEAKHEQLQVMVGRQGNDLAETRRRNEELGNRVRQLEEENCRLRDSNERLNSQLTRVEAGQQSGIALLQKEIIEGELKAKKNLLNVLEELAKLKWEIKRMTMTTKRFRPSMKKGRLRLRDGRETDEMYDIPDGIIAHLTRECGGNVDDHCVVDVKSGSFEKEIEGANPHSGAFDNHPRWAAKNVSDLATESCFASACRMKQENIPQTRTNWVCYDFKERRIMPTHYTIRTNDGSPGNTHLKSWLVETSQDGETWQKVALEEDNKQLNGKFRSATFPVADNRECRFIRLVNIGRNHWGSDQISISGWEIFGSLIE
jgi:hypothetical protein